MTINHVFERADVYVVFSGESTIGLHYKKDSTEGKEIAAYLLAHPDAVQPEPVPPPPTDAHLEAAAEAQRQARFAEYDTAIMRLKRAERMGDTTATASIAQWDEYAVALQMLNDSAGWFRDPQWPARPEV